MQPVTAHNDRSDPAKKAAWHDHWQSEPWWRQLLRAGAISAVMALVFTIVGFIAFADGRSAWRNWSGWVEYYLAYLAISLCIGGFIHGFFRLGFWLVGFERVRGFERWQRVLFFGGLPTAGVAAGLATAQWLGAGHINIVNIDDNKAFGMLLFSLMVMVVVYQLYGLRYRRLDAERRATEAQLRLLQGQMEPHFLFNTLANVLSLIESDTPRAKLMLEAFVDYLRSSLGELRHTDVSLQAEIDLATAYLQVQQLRMDDRLRVVIEADAEARGVRLPPLLVQPLLENAIQHGLEPKIEGGTVRLRAWCEQDRLVVEVDDDGLGMDHATPGRTRSPGHGIALANVRERLASRFGGAARLDIAALSPGTRCRLELPYPAG